MDDHTFEDIKFLLKRNWFLDTEEIYNLLYSLTDEEWLNLLENANKYPRNVRECIDNIRPLTPTVSVKEYSDEDMHIFTVDQKIELFKKLDTLWEKHKLENNITPPSTLFDARYEDLKNKLDFEKSKLSLYKKPPTSLSKTINDLKNEIEDTLTLITGINKNWEEVTKWNYIRNEAVQLL